MDKFSDNFSDKGYEELLNEYAGESVNNRIRQNNENRAKRQEKKPAPKSAGSSSSSSLRNKQKPDTKKKADYSVNKKTVERKAEPAARKPASYDLNIKGIQSFEEDAKPAARSERQVRTNAPARQQPVQTRPAPGNPVNKEEKKTIFSRKNKTNTQGQVSSDTMEFNKNALKNNTPVQNNQGPVIVKRGPVNNNIVQNGKKRNRRKKGPRKPIRITLGGFISFILCIVVASLLSLFLLSCANDVLAIGRDSSKVVEVTLPNDADTETAVSILSDAGLIKNQLFCRVFLKAMGYTDKNYLPGVYYFTQSMGVEKMIIKFKSSSVRGNLISITIPEGYTIDQIAVKLEKNHICSADSFFKTIDDIDFSKEYSFLSSVDKKEDRYHALEGYMFPATYEFEENANPASVVRAFLSAFATHWTEEYAEKAKELNMSVDDVITMASIIEKEGANAEQFAQISSVLHNRINRTGLYPTLECDSTRDYVTNTISSRVTSSSELNKYILEYNTYECEGLPVGAICNPGEVAINAALNPDETSYYFFAHDNKKKIYLAETAEQHSINLRTINSINSETY
ncbi:MAG: endolytic transglycosylase MltG [Clostridiales bacterium]|nr:endolytic transglycosylase MltG [Clostridiales bacterium]